MGNRLSTCFTSLSNRFRIENCTASTARNTDIWRHPLLAREMLPEHSCFCVPTKETDPDCDVL
jgi:hypothetical protein